MAATQITKRIRMGAFLLAGSLLLVPSALQAHGGGGGGGGGMGAGGGMGGGMGMGAGMGMGNAAGHMNGNFGGQSSSHVSTSGMTNGNGPNTMDRDTGLNRSEDRRSASATLHSRALRHHHGHQIIPDADEPTGH